MKILETFLEKHNACLDGFEFAKDLTLKQFLETCERGDWILWLFARTNPKSLRELTLAKAQCANTVRHLMTDKRSVEAVDVAIAFGEGRATREELNAAAAAAYVAVADAYSAVADAAYVAAAARKQNQKQTADICRKFLPIEIWDQSQF